MAIEFKNVTKIIGPGGKEVTKITRTSDNVILWQNGGYEIVDSNGYLKSNFTISMPVYQAFQYTEHRKETAAIEPKLWYALAIGRSLTKGNIKKSDIFYFDIPTGVSIAGKTLHIDNLRILGSDSGYYEAVYVRINFNSKRTAGYDYDFPELGVWKQPFELKIPNPADEIKFIVGYQQETSLTTYADNIIQIQGMRII